MLGLYSVVSPNILSVLTDYRPPKEVAVDSSIRRPAELGQGGKGRTLEKQFQSSGQRKGELSRRCGCWNMKTFCRAKQIYEFLTLKKESRCLAEDNSDVLKILMLEGETSIINTYSRVRNKLPWKQIMGKYKIFME